MPLIVSSPGLLFYSEENLYICNKMYNIYIYISHFKIFATLKIDTTVYTLNNNSWD